MYTWPFGLPVCDSAQPEDHSALILLHNLQEENHRTPTQVTQEVASLVLLFEAACLLLTSLTLTQNQIVMGNKIMTKMPDSMTKIQPMHPRDPVRSARWIEKCNTEAHS